MARWFCVHPVPEWVSSGWSGFLQQPKYFITVRAAISIHLYLPLMILKEGGATVPSHSKTVLGFKPAGQLGINILKLHVLVPELFQSALVFSYSPKTCGLGLLAMNPI